MSSSTKKEKDLSIDFTAGIEDIPSEQPFSWLKFPEKWTPDNLLNDIDSRTQKRYCKVCDDHVHPWQAEDHITDHIIDEYARLERKRVAAAEAREVARELEREAKLAEREAAKAERAKSEPVKPVKVQRRTRKPRGTAKALTFTIPDGDFTVAAVANENGLDRTEVRNHLTRLVGTGELIVAGKVKSGGRGRPALIYAKK